MLSHTITNFRPGGSIAAREVQDAAVWAAIESALGERAELTTHEISVHIGLSSPATRERLYKLRELGEVRLGAGRDTGTNKRALTWLLGAEDYAARAEKLTPTITRAVQLGTFQRDPLVAALFGLPQSAVTGASL